MKKLRKTLASITLVGVLAFSSYSSVFAEKGGKVEPSPTYRSYENEEALDPLEESKFDNEIDLEGNVKEIPSVKFIKLKKGDKTPSGETLTWTDPDTYYDAAGYKYVFSDYIQSSASKKLTTFKVMDVSLDNRSSGTVKLKYIQSSSVTKSWSVDGEISGSSSFGTKFLAKVDASLTIGASKSNTAAESTTVEFDMNVPPGKRGMITKYFPGGYGTGTSYWKKYTSTGTYVGQITKSNDGYAVAKNHDHFVVSETSL
jgi:hypothetical protein